MNIAKWFKRKFDYRRDRLSLCYGFDEGIDVHAVTIGNRTTIVVVNQEERCIEPIDDLKTRTCLLYHMTRGGIKLAKNIVWHK